MSAATLQHQRGAVTLIGALFLIITLVVLLGAVQRMAATDIIDSALGNDAVEALFLAETGLERAAWRYAGGTSCPLLAGETAAAGRGDFLVVSSSLVGTLCQVRVEGRITSTTAEHTARRTVEGGLLLASGGAGLWAVGQTGGDEAGLFVWEGGTWTGSTAPVQDEPEMNGVYCVSSSDCWAVGNEDGEDPNLLHWDGGTWTSSPTGGLPEASLNSVYCVASDDCWAVGERDDGETILHWDGSSWSRAGPYGGVRNTDLYSVYCVASNDCWAVGRRSGSETIIHWDGSTWSRSGPYGSVPNVDLNSIYCVASDDCWAVGRLNRRSVNIIHWDGSTWSSVAVSGVRGVDLTSVHCVASDDCWAVGRRSRGRETILHWDGSRWSNAGPYAGVPNQHLTQVYMVSATEGYLIGNNDTFAVWDGNTWTSHPVPPGVNLNAIAFADGGGSGGSGGGGGGGGGSGGAVQLVRWTEVIQ